jgi:lysosomal alpha-mannosidase
MGVMQHHDAITGTEKQAVADDYALRISQAFDDCHLSTQTAMK